MQASSAAECVRRRCPRSTMAVAHWDSTRVRRAHTGAVRRHVGPRPPGYAQLSFLPARRQGAAQLTTARRTSHTRSATCGWTSRIPDRRMADAAEQRWSALGRSALAGGGCAAGDAQLTRPSACCSSLEASRRRAALLAQGLVPTLVRSPTAAPQSPPSAGTCRRVARRTSRVEEARAEAS